MSKKNVYYDNEENFLSASWDEDLEKELQESYNIDLSQEMNEVMEYQLKDEKIRQIFHDQINGNGYVDNFDKVSYFNKSPVEGDKMLFFIVESPSEGENEIDGHFTKFFYPSEMENFIDSFHVTSFVKSFPVVRHKE